MAILGITGTIQYYYNNYCTNCRPMTINRLVESMVINLSLTGGSGFYHSEGKESLWIGRKIVIRDVEIGMATDKLLCSLELYNDC